MSTAFFLSYIKPRDLPCYSLHSLKAVFFFSCIKDVIFKKYFAFCFYHFVFIFLCILSSLCYLTSISDHLLVLALLFFGHYSVVNIGIITEKSFLPSLMNRILAPR